jgi:hypothetical protein
MKAFQKGELDVEFQKKTCRPRSQPYYWECKEKQKLCEMQVIGKFSRSIRSVTYKFPLMGNCILHCNQLHHYI